MLSLLFNNPLYFLSFLVSLVIAITIHEFAHAWMADKLGDPTPRLNNRLTLNPLAHLDPIGTLALLIARVGWGKPVPIDPYNFKNARRDTAIVSLAGPASNILLAILLSLILKFSPITHFFSQRLIIPWMTLLTIAISLNITLAIFNLLPIPPLDGAKILLGFLPVKWGIKLEEGLSQYGVFLLIFLIFPFFKGASLISYIIFPIVALIVNLLL